LERDSFFGERIIWTGGAKVVKLTPAQRFVAWLLFIFSGVATSYAVVIGLALQIAPTASLLFAGWCVTLGLAVHQLPQYWLAKVRYIVTDKHVIWQRGLFRRTIERRSISYARIYWDAKESGVGDLELVRAVPTGALRRRLTLRLALIAAPDRVWAIVRGAEGIAPTGEAGKPLAQRLDLGERVVWSARPRPRVAAYLPHSRREGMMTVLALVLIGVGVLLVTRSVLAVQNVLAAGLPGRSFAFAALVLGLTTSVVLVFAIAGLMLYTATVRAGYLVRHTRYLVTDTRVLIQRDLEELHLDRSRVVEVIDTPMGEGYSNVFIVLDGPRARALAASGAFGESDRSPNLRPVFESVQDAESLSRILLEDTSRVAASS
jgi:hypothetical protein